MHLDFLGFLLSSTYELLYHFTAKLKLELFTIRNSFMPYKEFGNESNFKPDNNLPLDLAAQPRVRHPVQHL